MADNQYDVKNVDTTRLTAEELEKLYGMYFIPKDAKAQTLMFEQVSLFDYSLASYATDSVSPIKVSYA